MELFWFRGFGVGLLGVLFLFFALFLDFFGWFLLLGVILVVLCVVVGTCFLAPWKFPLGLGFPFVGFCIIAWGAGVKLLKDLNDSLSSRRELKLVNVVANVFGGGVLCEVLCLVVGGIVVCFDACLFLCPCLLWFFTFCWFLFLLWFWRGFLVGFGGLGEFLFLVPDIVGWFSAGGGERSKSGITIGVPPICIVTVFSFRESWLE